MTAAYQLNILLIILKLYIKTKLSNVHNHDIKCVEKNIIALSVHATTCDMNTWWVQDSHQFHYILILLSRKRDFRQTLLFEFTREHGQKYWWPWWAQTCFGCVDGSTFHCKSDVGKWEGTAKYTVCLGKRCFWTARQAVFLLQGMRIVLRRHGLVNWTYLLGLTEKL